MNRPPEQLPEYRVSRLRGPNRLSLFRRQRYRARRLDEHVLRRIGIFHFNPSPTPANAQRGPNLPNK